jgi:hypothetical protein
LLFHILGTGEEEKMKGYGNRNPAPTLLGALVLTMIFYAGCGNSREPRSMPSPASATSGERQMPKLEPNQNERAHLAAAEIARAMKGVERTEPIAELPMFLKQCGEGCISSLSAGPKPVCAYFVSPWVDELDLIFRRQYQDECALCPLLPARGRGGKLEPELAGFRDGPCPQGGGLPLKER